MKKAVFLLLIMTAVSSQAHALTVLKDKEAADHIGDPKAHFVGQNYTFEMLKRSHRDAMHGRFSDGVIFNSGGGLFSYPRRKDGDHKVLIDDPAGREEEPVTEDVWRRDIANSLSDDNPQPMVFLDEQGKEIAVLYTGQGTQAKSKMTDSGLLEISLEVPGGKDARGRRR